MPVFAIPYPEIDPILVTIGPLAIRWYALAYVVGILVGWRYILLVARRPPQILTARDVDDLVVWITLGVILGGRLGYILFYRPEFYFSHPLEMLYVWHGGMSFHGGLIGVMAAMIWFGISRKIDPVALADRISCAVPIGLFFGRIANFINGELFGRVTDVPWAMVFPNGGPLPRHPSQIYEAFLEGAVLFAVLYWLAWRGGALARRGMLTGVFLVGYAIARSIAEFFRQPDFFMPHFPLGVTMGQILSLPLLLGGLYLWFYLGKGKSGRS
jgi:phosphatidylglycerol:prolipoprotein diacylglycerol transferase